jgi:hypothetical protein
MKNHNYQPQYEKKIEWFFFHMYNHHTQQQKPFTKSQSQNVTTKILRNVKFLNLNVR